MRKKGEIATTLAVITMIVMGLGVIIGVRQTLTRRLTQSSLAQLFPPLSEKSIPAHGKLTIQSGLFEINAGIPTFLLEGTFSTGNTASPGYREVIVVAKSQFIADAYGGFTRTYLYPGEKRDFRVRVEVKSSYQCGSSLPITIMLKDHTNSRVGEIVYDLKQLCTSQPTSTPTITPTPTTGQTPTATLSPTPTTPLSEPTNTPTPTTQPISTTTPTQPAGETPTPSPTIPDTGEGKITGRLIITTIFPNPQPPPFNGALYVFDYDAATNQSYWPPVDVISLDKGVNLTGDHELVAYPFTVSGLIRDKKYVLAVVGGPYRIPLSPTTYYEVILPATRCPHPENAILNNPAENIYSDPWNFCIIGATADGLPGQDFGSLAAINGEINIEGSCKEAESNVLLPLSRVYNTVYDYEDTKDQKDEPYSRLLYNPHQEESQKYYQFKGRDSVDPKSSKPICIASFHVSATGEPIYQNEQFPLGVYYLDLRKDPFPQALYPEGKTCNKPDFKEPYCIYTMGRFDQKGSYTYGNFEATYNANSAFVIPPPMPYRPTNPLSGRITGSVTLNKPCINLPDIPLTLDLYRQTIDNSKKKYPTRFDAYDRALLIDKSAVVSQPGSPQCQFIYEVTGLEEETTYAVGIKKQKNNSVGTKLPTSEQTQALFPSILCNHPLIPASFPQTSNKFCVFKANSFGQTFDFSEQQGRISQQKLPKILRDIIINLGRLRQLR